jgi:uncharacterized OB-fold protein
VADNPSAPEPPTRVELPEEAEFWQHVDAGELALVRCDECGAWSGFARSCVVCGSRDYSWHVASGRATVRSVAVFHRGFHPYFEAALPYNVAVLALDEGPDLVTNVVDVPPEEVEVGMPVRIVMRRRGENLIPLAVPLGPGELAG